MRLNTIVTLGASAVFGILSVFMARAWIKGAVASQYQTPSQAVQLSTAQSPSRPTLPVLVADIDLVFGDEMSRDALRLVDMPEELVPLGAFGDVSDLLKTDMSASIVALADIRANEIILPHKVSGHGEKASLSARIQSGYRAATIRVDDVTGVAGFVIPGDLVDIVYTYEPNPDADIPEYHTEIILQSVKVLGTDQSHAEKAATPGVARTITVEVAHSDAQALAAASERGSLSLALRAVGETETSTATKISSNSLGQRRSTTRSSVRSSAPRKLTGAKPAFDPRTDIVVIRGEETSSVKVLSEKSTGVTSPLGATELAGG